MSDVDFDVAGGWRRNSRCATRQNVIACGIFVAVLITWPARCDPTSWIFQSKNLYLLQLHVSTLVQAIFVYLRTCNQLSYLIYVQDYALEEKINADGQLVYTGKVKKRLCLVLDCLIAHEFDPQSAAYINLQQYVIKEKKLREREALVIFYNIVSIVERLHRVLSRTLFIMERITIWRYD